jgi:molybdopterin molybdotransferase
MDNVFITYEEALGILKEHTEAFPTEERSLEKCVAAYLAEDLIADRDFPPFDRVTMDGIAISYEVFERGKRAFHIESTSAAGTPQKKLKNPENCVEVMTGTVLPENTNTVIRYEDLNIDKGIATVVIDKIQYGQSIHSRGVDIARGTPIVKQGKQLSSAEINIAAAIGKSSLRVKKLPKVIIFSTGDELVKIDDIPQLHQIRRSNIYGIRHTLNEWGLVAELQHLPDDKTRMKDIIASHLEAYDLLMFTGGVSKGKFDFLPDVLESLGINKHFHKIQQRPGKPFWFGSGKQGKKVFALPGNPVSSFVCVYIYFQYWLKSSLGLELAVLNVKLTEDVEFKPNLVYFLEAVLKSGTDGILYATPLPGNGSGDFANLVRTEGFLILPQDKTHFRKGEVYPFIAYRQ